MPDTENLPPVEELSAGCLDTQSVTIDWSELEYDTWGFFQAFTYTIDRLDSEGEPDDVEVVAIADTNRVVAVFIDGHRIDLTDDRDEDKIDCPHCNGDGCERCENSDGLVWPRGVTDADLDTIENLDPTVNGAEGPMMNYHYPLGDSRREHGSGVIGGYHFQEDEIATAFKLRNVELCLIEIDGDFSLALTGGGMDLTWSIVEAFCALGYLPPVAFCQPPGFGTSQQEYLVSAMRRSLTFQRDRITNKLEYLDQHGLDR